MVISVAVVGFVVLLRGRLFSSGIEVCCLLEVTLHSFISLFYEWSYEKLEKVGGLNK